MASGTDLINNHWKEAECGFYAGGSALALNAAVASLVTGQFWGTIAAAAGGLAFEYAAGLAGCNYDPGDPTEIAGPLGCQKTATGLMNAHYTSETKPKEQTVFLTRIKELVSVNVVYNHDTTTGGTVYDAIDWVAIDDTGTQISGKYRQPASQRPIEPIYTELIDDATCEIPYPVPEPLPPDAIGRPTVVTEEDCEWTFTPYDSFIDGTGAVQVYWVIEANNDACGGPFAYWSGPSGPQPVNPNPPDESPDPILPPDIKDDEGTDQIQKELKEIKEQLDVIQNCACDDPKPELLGDWVSIRFVSDGISPGGTNPLRKLFRYRSQSSRTDEQLREYWSGFTWTAGPVIVSHKGTWWGTPQVWASSAEEGKRVLRFAAGEAGATPDTDGEWIVTGSASPRYGMSGTMRIQQYRGRDWVTSRIGPSGPVEL